jgi:hypothetical protein
MKLTTPQEIYHYLGPKELMCDPSKWRRVTLRLRKQRLDSKSKLDFDRGILAYNNGHFSFVRERQQSPRFDQSTKSHGGVELPEALFAEGWVPLTG